MCVHIYTRAYECGQIVIKTHAHDKHTNGTQDTTGKGRNQAKREKPLYIGKIAANEKKYKKVKKNLELRKKVVTL